MEPFLCWITLNESIHFEIFFELPQLTTLGATQLRNSLLNIHLFVMTRVELSTSQHLRRSFIEKIENKIWFFSLLDSIGRGPSLCLIVCSRVFSITEFRELNSIQLFAICRNQEGKRGKIGKKGIFRMNAMSRDTKSGLVMTRYFTLFSLINFNQI